ARAKDFETAIQWLMDAGIVCKVERITKPVKPLKFYTDLSAFKLFVLDCGLLGAMCETSPVDMLVAENGMAEYKGAFTELFVLTQLLATQENSVFYYSSDSKLEIDFLLQHGQEVCALEVKAEENLRAKSLFTFKQSHPHIRALRFSLSDYREQDWMKNIPLYAVGFYFR
ncbi:MAG: DUF4143 domain-containing protein, partial [Alloprevotella sp.]